MFNFKIISKNLISQTEAFLHSVVLFKKLRPYLKIKKYKLKNSYAPAFTLIELLVVIVIIGVLATLATVAVNGARTRARDSKRVSDLKQISTALEMYYTDYTAYPNIITPGQPLTSLDGTKTYMAKVPNNPTPRAEGACADLEYQYSAGNDNYSLIGCLSKAVGDVPAGARKMEKGGQPRDLGPTNGLVGWWMLDGINGTKDLSNLGNNGVLVGAVTSTGRFGESEGAYKFSDTKYVSVPSFTFPSDFYTASAKTTFSFWFKMSDMTNGYYSNFITKNNFSNLEFFIMKHWSSHMTYTYLGTPTESTYITAYSVLVAEGKWYHAVVVIDYTLSSQRIKTYLNGLISGHSGPQDGVVMTQNTALLTIGNIQRSGYSQGLRGDMADVRIYNRALSEAEVSDLYSATKP